MTATGRKARCTISIVDLRIEQAAHEHIWKTADPHERARTFEFASEHLGRRWLATRIAARHLVAQQTSTSAADVSILNDEAGRPFVDGGDCHVSISKSGHRAAIAIGHTDIGVDIEEVVPLNQAPALARRFLHPADADAIERDPNPQAAFYRAWVRLEAVLKCRGTGFDGSAPPPVLEPIFDAVENLNLRGISPTLVGAVSVKRSWLSEGCKQRPVAFSNHILPELIGMQTIDEVLSIAG